MYIVQLIIKGKKLYFDGESFDFSEDRIKAMIFYNFEAAKRAGDYASSQGGVAQVLTRTLNGWENI